MKNAAKVTIPIDKFKELLGFPDSADIQSVMFIGTEVKILTLGEFEDISHETLPAYKAVYEGKEFKRFVKKNPKPYGDL